MHNLRGLNFEEITFYGSLSKQRSKCKKKKASSNHETKMRALTKGKPEKVLRKPSAWLFSYKKVSLQINRYIDILKF